MKFLTTVLLLLAAGGLASAQVQTPEIDPGSAGTALALLAGGLLVIRTFRKK